MTRANLDGQILDGDVRSPLDKTAVTSVRVEGAWNVTGAHHLWASYTMTDWTLSAKGYEEDIQ